MVAFAAHLSRFAKSSNCYHPPRTCIPSFGGFQCPYAVAIRRPPCPPRYAIRGGGEAGRWDLGSLSGGVSLSTCFPPCGPFLFSGFGSLVFFFHFLTCLFLVITSTISYSRRLLLSCATSLIYHPLCRSVYICRSITRIRLFINYGISSLFSIHVSNPVFRCRAAPLPQNPYEVDLCHH